MLVYEIIILLVVALSTIGLGMRVSLQDLVQAFRDWDALILVAAGQYLLMPLLTWLAIQALDAPGETNLAIAVVLLGPGSEAGLVGVFLARGNLPLAVIAIVMTNILSPLVAPELISLIVAEQAATLAAALPVFADIMAIVFLAIVAPFAIGMTIRQLTAHSWDVPDRSFRFFLWLAFLANVIYAALAQAFEPPNIEVASNVSALAAIVAVTMLAFVLVYSLGRTFRVRPDCAVAASFIVSLQPIAVGLYVASNLQGQMPVLTSLSIGYAMVLPFMIIVWITVVGRRLPLALR